MQNRRESFIKGDRRDRARYMARAAMLTAVAAVLYYLELPFPLFAAWLKLDFSFVPVLIGGFALGPAAGAAILLVKDLIGLLHSSSGGVGELADFIVGLSLLLPAALFYAGGRTKRRALLGMLVGIVLMTIAGVVCNRYIFVPLLVGDALAGAELTRYLVLAVVPFNLVKGLANCALTFALYKSLRRAHIL